MSDARERQDDPSTSSPKPSAGAKVRSDMRAMSTWQKVLLGVAALLVVAGLVLLLVEGGSDSGGSTPRTGSNSTAPGTLGSQLVDGGQAGGQTAGAEEADRDWSPVFLKMGFSFFAGFAIGYALRAFLKITLVVAGAILIALFALQHFELVTVEWDTMGQQFDRIIAALKGQAASFKDLIQGSLPSAGLAGLGLFTGFRKG